MAEANQTRWPSDSLDVPSDAAGRAAYERLRQVQLAFRESAYRSRMAAATTCPDDRLRQQTLGQSAVAEAVGRLGPDA